jgi:hypothetical protein
LLVISVTVLFFVYEIYTAIYPTDSFYFDEFKKVTSLDIPKSAEIINKTASYPDFHGDYISCSIIKLSKPDYKLLLDTISNDKDMLKNPDLGGSKQLDDVMETKKVSDIKRAFTRNMPGKDYIAYIGFFDDDESVLVYFINP